MRTPRFPPSAAAVAVALIAGAALAAGGCGSGDGSSASAATTRAAAGTVLTCPGSGSLVQSLRVENQLSSAVTIDNGAVKCSEWKGTANPSTMNGASVDPGSASATAKMVLTGTCGTWNVRVGTGAEEVGPVPVRLCKTVSTGEGRVRWGTLRVQSGTAWAKTASIGSVVISAGEAGAASFVLTVAGKA